MEQIDYSILTATSLPSAYQLNELSARGDELSQVVEHNGNIFVYLKRSWSGPNVTVSGREYNVLVGDDLPNEDNLATLRDDGWELVQLVPMGARVLVYVSRLAEGER